MFNEPFRGITTDGHALGRSFRAAKARGRADAGDDRSRQRAAEDHVSGATEVDQAFRPGSNMWRHWQNTELYVEHYGLRLDEISEPLRDAVLAVLRARS